MFLWHLLSRGDLLPYSAPHFQRRRRVPQRQACVVPVWVDQSQHLLTFGAKRVLFRDTVLCLDRLLAVSLVSTY